MRGFVLLLLCSSALASVPQEWKRDLVDEDKFTCWICNSADGDGCDNDNKGIQNECDEGIHGCTISEVTKDAEITFIRECMQLGAEIGCQKNEDNGMNTRFCNCDSKDCNENWDSAGENSDPTDELTCWLCNSADGDGCSDENKGIQAPCPAESRGCTISQVTDKDKNVFIRECLVNPDAKIECQDNKDGDMRNRFCNCEGKDCNESWKSAGEDDKPTDKLKCYECNSMDGQECSEEMTGEEKECNEMQTMCSISKVTKSDGKVEFVRMCAEGPPTREGSDIGCTTKTENGEEEHACNCDTSLCNKNWETAGETSKLSCWMCNSEDGDGCDETHKGIKTDCPPESKACTISATTDGDKTVFVRECNIAETPEIKCGDDTKDGIRLKFCNCEGNDCNESWELAGWNSGSSLHVNIIVVATAAILAIFALF